VAPLAEATLARLAKVLPARWKPGNPIDLGFDADGKRYADAIAALGQATEVDGILVLNVPNALVDGVAVAEAVVAAQRACHISLLTCWLGGEAAAPARAVLSEAGLPTYESLSQAVGAFSHLVEYQAAQEKLMETPPAAPPGEAPPDRDSARTIIARALATADGLISDADCHALLAAYDIPVVETVTTTRAAGAAAVAAEQLGFPVVLSLASPDLPNKWESGLVALNLESAEAVRFAADEMLARIRRSHPEATVNGFAVQRMVLRPNARKLMIGIACDRLFGPVIVFGAGGRAPDVVRDHTIAFPPLNLAIARRVIERPRAARLLQAHGLRPAADHDAVAGVLVRLSRLLVDNPEIVACDINPLFADEQGALALDVRIRVAPLDESDRRRFSILPYPNHLAESARMKDGGAVRLRPIRPEDEPAHADMLSRTAPEDLRLRFFGVTRKLDHHQLAKLTQLDYQREMAIIATRPADDGQAETLAVMRTVTDPDNRTAELAILVRSDLKGRGLGTLLMDKILRYQRQRGTYEIVAHMLSENEGMRALARKFGLTPRPAEDPGMVSYGLVLNPPAEGAPG